MFIPYFKMKKTLLFIALFSLGFMHSQDFKGVVDSFFNQNRAQFGLNAQDVSDLHIYNQHFSKTTAVNHVYVVQRHQGIEVFNSISNFAISNNNEIKNAEVQFIPLLSSKVNTINPSLTPSDAIYQAAAHLGLSNPNELQLIDTPQNNNYVFNTGGISQENIKVKLVFQPNLDQSVLRLAWDLDIYLLDGNHWYSVRIDAQTGALLNTHDWVSSCDLGEFHLTEHNLAASKINQSSILEVPSNKSITPNDGSQYRVFALPNESPNHGPDTLEEEPADPVASPFGWHDTNGIAGPEFTITRGNNVRARADLGGNNGGASAEGGPDLNFDFPFNFNQQPLGYADGATTNLFYWNNIIHDVFVRYGFDEASGNFQETNYSGQGLGNDSVNADAQDGGGMNNANFATPPEGNRPRMQMYLWSAQGPPGEPLTINNGPLAGGYIGVGANFGPGLPLNPLTADLVVVEDDNSGPSTDENDGCDTILNGAQISGKIAVIRRGECQFGFKVLAAQNQGAVAAIIVNNVPGDPIAMAPGDVGAQVTIPSIMVNQANGEAIITELLGGATVNGTLQESGPFMIDGTLDNGIIAHEYGHGISNRLTGGAFNSGCLGNDEQMGEGWSDYFGLILTMKEGDTPGQRRGIGTFATGQPTDGNGIRPAPYTTNFAINNFTYGATNNPGLSQPHGVGFVWATMLWELTWDLIDVYGFDADIYEGTGGNNIALQLVVDALKLQPCSPGFVNGRDAILLADELANEGANQCIIWNAFARRGLGLSASQGSSNNRFDQVEAFDIPEECLLGTQGQSINNFMIYPNPSQGDVYIVSKEDKGNSTISIYDINGRMVFNQDVMMNGTISIQAGNLKAGVYIVEIKGENYTHNAKLIIR